MVIDLKMRPIRELGNNWENLANNGPYIYELLDSEFDMGPWTILEKRQNGLCGPLVKIDIP